MGRKIVITSGKGGVGKTTATANIGTALSIMGRSVAVVDADIGLRNLDIIMGLEARVVYTSMDVVEGKCELSKALVRGRTENLRLLAASQRNNKSDFPPDEMLKICDKLQEEFDYVIIDSPAGIEEGFLMSVAAAGEAIIVTTPEVHAIRDADRTIGLVQSKGIEEPLLIINRISPEMIEKGDMIEPKDIYDVLSIDIVGIVPEDREIIVSTNKGTPLTLSKNSPSGEAYKRIARRIDGEKVPIPSFKENGFLSKIRKIFGNPAEGG